jgi:hypothetical protein
MFHAVFSSIHRSFSVVFCSCSRLFHLPFLLHDIEIELFFNKIVFFIEEKDNNKKTFLYQMFSPNITQMHQYLHSCVWEKWPFFLFACGIVVDWLVFNANCSNISAILWRYERKLFIMIGVFWAYSEEKSSKKMLSYLLNNIINNWKQN